MMNPLQSFLVRLLGRSRVISSEPLNMNIHTSNHICKKNVHVHHSMVLLKNIEENELNKNMQQ